MALTPPSQQQYLSPYGQQVFQYGTADSKIFISRYTNNLLKALTLNQNNVILQGFHVTYSISGNTVHFSIAPGMLIQDTTLLELTQPFEFDVDLTGQSSGYLCIFSRFKYSEDLAPNPFSIAVVYVDDTGTPQPIFDMYIEDMDTVLLMCLTISRDGETLVLNEADNVSINGKQVASRPPSWALQASGLVGITSVTNDYVATIQDAYLVVDASNNRVTNDQVGTGDGNTTTFSLTKPPIVANSETIYINGSDVTTITKDVTGETIGTGDGSTTEFNYTAQHKPLKPNSITIYYTIGGTDYTAVDDGSGNIEGTELTGAVDYDNATITLSFNTPPDDTTSIVMDYSYYPYTYTLDNTTGELVFNEAPGDGDVITADYQRAQLDIRITTKEKSIISIKKIDDSSYPVVITPTSGTIDGNTSWSITTQNVAYKLVCDGSNWWIF